MAMLRLIARDSGWLAVLPEVVVQDELRTGWLVTGLDPRSCRRAFLRDYCCRIQNHQPHVLEELLGHAGGA